MAHLDLADIDDGAILAVLHHAIVSFPSATADSTMTLIPEMQRRKFREVREVQINIMHILTTQGLKISVRKCKLTFYR